MIFVDLYVIDCSVIKYILGRRQTIWQKWREVRPVRRHIVIPRGGRRGGGGNGGSGGMERNWLDSVNILEIEADLLVH